MATDTKPGFDAEPIGPTKEKADARAAALAKAPTLASAYGPAHLAADRDRELVAVDKLPGWPTTSPRDAYEWGHGVGPELNKAIGGGLQSGTIIGVGAAAAKAGKTALIHQISDGLALLCAERLANKGAGPLTPVVVLSEMDARALSWRSLARWTGYPASYFRAGQSAAKWPEYSEAMWETAADALESGPLAGARKVTRHMRTTSGGALLVEELKAVTGALREELGAGGREVWPVVMLDPAQRYAGNGKSATEAADDFVKALNNATRAEGWIVLLTSDATKATATGASKGDNLSPEEEGAAVFRGSYVLQHILDAALYLRPKEDGQVRRNDRVRELEVVSVFNRWGVGGGKPVPFELDGPTMRLRSTSSAGGEVIATGVKRK